VNFTPKKKRKNSFPVIVFMNITLFAMIFAWTIFGILVFPVVFLLLSIFTRWRVDRTTRLIIWLYGRGWLVIVAPFVKFKTEGLKNNIPDKPCIFVINHLSFFDTYCMALLPFSEVVFAIRAWPFKMFWFAPFMRLACYLNVETTKWETISEAGIKTLSKGSYLLFFPEGHRSRDGQIQRFFSGAFKLAVKSGTAVVPLCITGTDNFFPPGRFWFEPARIYVKALPPVDPKSFSGESAHTQMKMFVKQTMAENIAKMREYE